MQTPRFKIKFFFSACQLLNRSLFVIRQRKTPCVCKCWQPTKTVSLSSTVSSINWLLVPDKTLLPHPPFPLPPLCYLPLFEFAVIGQTTNSAWIMVKHFIMVIWLTQLLKLLKYAAWDNFIYSHRTTRPCQWTILIHSFKFVKKNAKTDKTLHDVV